MRQGARVYTWLAATLAQPLLDALAVGLQRLERYSDHP
jgi:hypothetical protein